MAVDIDAVDRDLRENHSVTAAGVTLDPLWTARAAISVVRRSRDQLPLSGALITAVFVIRSLNISGDRLKALARTLSRCLRVEFIEPIGEQFDTDRIESPDIIDNPNYCAEIAFARKSSVVQ